MRSDETKSMARGIVAILLVGTALGLAYNAMGLASRPSRGLKWIGTDRLAELPSLEAADADADGAGAPAEFTTDVTDPMAVGITPRAASNVPDVQEMDRPMQVSLEAVKQFFDAEAALFVDAREGEEYAAGHIPGAVSLTFEDATSEPERLVGLDGAGRPIIAYCGGGACELSLELAWELIFAGNTRVLVYMGGFPEWVAAGYPVETGAGPDRGYAP